MQNYRDKESLKWEREEESRAESDRVDKKTA